MAFRCIVLRLATLLPIVTAVLLASPVLSAEAPWANQSYHYIVIKQNVRDVLQEFGRNLSLPMEVSRSVKGEMRGDIHADSAGDFLRKVCEANDLAWFYDGYVLHVVSNEELDRQIIDLDGVDADRLQTEINEIEIGDPLNARLRNGGSRLEVAGPPAWLAEIEQRVSSLRRPTPASAPDGVRVFRGSVTTPPAP